MPVQELKAQKCAPCEGGTPALPESESSTLLKQVTGWSFTAGKKGIIKSYRMKDFSAAVEFMRKIAEVANREDHHPDLHLTGYRNLQIELSTHSIGGLSKNDFILAAKIDELPKELKAG
jgi:4a-hydroxytetrahydrobiopterin dehydratase